MKTSAFKLLLCTGFFKMSLCFFFGGNIYVSEKMTWSEAREYCRKYYTDMSSISSLEENEKIIALGEENTTNSGNPTPLLFAVNSTTTNTFKNVWTGLYKDINDTWKWSGGKNALFFNWIPSQKQGVDDNCVVQREKGWEAVKCDEKFPFFCFQSNLVLVKGNKTWEEAMEHCHSLDKELVSVPSEPSLNKVLQTSMAASTAHVWTGLRYLGDSWLWVDGTCSEFQASSQDEMPLCPTWTHHCGALSLEEQQIISWDCADKLNFICY